MATRCYTPLSLEPVMRLTPPGVARIGVFEDNTAMHRLCGHGRMRGSRTRFAPTLVLAALAATNAARSPS